MQHDGVSSHHTPGILKHVAVRTGMAAQQHAFPRARSPHLFADSFLNLVPGGHIWGDSAGVSIRRWRVVHGWRLLRHVVHLRELRLHAGRHVHHLLLLLRAWAHRRQRLDRAADKPRRVACGAAGSVGALPSRKQATAAAPPPALPPDGLCPGPPGVCIAAAGLAIAALTAPASPGPARWSCSPRAHAIVSLWPHIRPPTWCRLTTRPGWTLIIVLVKT